MARSETVRPHNPVARVAPSFYNTGGMRGACGGFGVTALSGLLGVSALFLSNLAPAAENSLFVGQQPPSTDESQAAGSQRRSGFTTGMSAGLLLGNGRGYPNEGEKIDDPAFETVTGVGLSAGGALWLGVAVSDWLAVSFGASGGGFRTRGRQATLAAFQFRVETYPLFALGGSWRDLGLLVASGVGVFRVDNEGEALVDGGGASAVGVGAFFEPLRWGGFAMGPTLDYTLQFAENFNAYSLVLGWRTAFYANP